MCFSLDIKALKQDDGFSVYVYIQWLLFLEQNSVSNVNSFCWIDALVWTVQLIAYNNVLIKINMLLDFTGMVNVYTREVMVLRNIM